MNQSLFRKELYIPSTIERLNTCLDVVSEIRDKFDFDTSFGLHIVILESVEYAFIHVNKGI